MNNAFFSHVVHHLDSGNGMERTYFSVSVLLLYCGNCTSLVKLGKVSISKLNSPEEKTDGTK